MDTSTHHFNQWVTKQGKLTIAPNELKPELKKLKTLDMHLKQWHQRQNRLNRLELEQIKSGLTHYIQLKTLQLSQERQQQQPINEYMQTHIFCFYTLAELAYSQSDIESLELIHQLRMWLLQELTYALQSNSMIKSINNPIDLMNHLNSIRLPWPIDRILATQLQNTPLLQKEQKRAQEAIAYLQKNPHLSVADYFTQQNIFLTPQLKKWSLSWTSKQVKMMQTEMANYQAVKLSLASFIYKEKYKKWPQTQSQLLKEDLINQRMINPLTQAEQVLPNFE